MKFQRVKRFPFIFLTTLAFAFLMLPKIAQAQWRATVGAQSRDMGRQALAFLPNEIWIHAGDNVTWTFNVDEIHTVTFLKSGQTRPLFFVGCPPGSASGSPFDGSMCVSTPPLTKGQTFNVVFPASGHYKLVCLVHPDMTAVVHVLDSSAVLPHDQAFYDKRAIDERGDLLSDTKGDEGQKQEGSPNSVTAGVGEVAATAGGHQTVSILRFLHHDAVVHAGDTVEWTNHDPATPHTITLGIEPQNPGPPSANVSPDSEGVPHATINSTADSVHSGLIGSAAQDQTGLPQTPLGVTRFRITFTTAGTYPYKCALHDTLGMKGRIIVLP